MSTNLRSRDLHMLLDQLAEDSLRARRTTPRVTAPLAVGAAVATVAALGLGSAALVQRHEAGVSSARPAAGGAGGAGRETAPATTGTGSDRETAPAAPFTLAQVSSLFGHLPFRAPTTTDVPTTAAEAIARTGDPNAVSLGLQRIGINRDAAWTGKYLYTNWYDAWVIVDRRPERSAINPSALDPSATNDPSRHPRAREYDSLVMWTLDPQTLEPTAPPETAAEKAQTPPGTPIQHWVEPLVLDPAYLAAHPDPH